MIKWWFLFVVISFLTIGAFLGPAEDVCITALRNVNQFSLNSKKDKTGRWITTASAHKAISNSTVEVHLDVQHNVIECNGKYIINLKGILTETAVCVEEKRMHFHRRGGKNVAFNDDRRTGYRTSDGTNGAAFTERPLRRNVMFEVRLDRSLTKYQYSLGIGITAHSPEYLDIPDNMNSLRSGTWIYYDTRVFNNETVVLENLKKNLNKLDEFQVGDHVGVMVKDPGVLHFYVNGVEQCALPSKIPHSVYGFVEMRGNAMQISIADKPSC